MYHAAKVNPWQLARKVCMSQLHSLSFANVKKFYKQFPICLCQSRSLVSDIYATCKNVCKINAQRNPAFTRQSSHKYQSTITGSSAKTPNFLKWFGTRPPWRNIHSDNYPIHSSVYLFSFQQYRLRFPTSTQLSCCKVLTFKKCSLKALPPRLWSTSKPNFTSGFSISFSNALNLTPARQQSYTRSYKFLC